VIDKISTAINQTLKEPSVVSALKAQGFDPLGGSPDDFASYIKSETERWARVIHDMDATQKN
jgi:tripartite-type tricarboxylate transporter receptor subunit TctC